MTILLEEDVVTYEDTVVNMSPSDEPLLLFVSSRGHFKSFESASSGDYDNIEATLLSSSTEAIASGTGHLPYHIIEMDETRYVKSDQL